jgi:HSP20 family molecular chaperone IbpA
MCNGHNYPRWNQNRQQGYCGPFWQQRGPFQRPQAEQFEVDTEFNEEKNRYEITIETPGVPKEKINLKANNEFLFIKIDDRVKEEDKIFERRYSFRQAVDLTNIKATYKNGLLMIDIPLKESEKQDITID